MNLNGSDLVMIARAIVLELNVDWGLRTVRRFRNRPSIRRWQCNDRMETEFICKKNMPWARRSAFPMEIRIALMRRTITPRFKSSPMPQPCSNDQFASANGRCQSGRVSSSLWLEFGVNFVELQGSSESWLIFSSTSSEMQLILHTLLNLC